MRIVALPLWRADEATTLWKNCGLTRPWNDPRADFERAVSGSASVVAGATEDSGRLLGTVMVGVDGHRGWVYYLATVPTARRQGIARGLMAWAERWIRDRDVPKIQFMVRTDNTDAMAFYHHLGYHRQDCLVLGRRLDETDAGPSAGHGS